MPNQKNSLDVKLIEYALPIAGLIMYDRRCSNDLKNDAEIDQYIRNTERLCKIAGIVTGSAIMGAMYSAALFFGKQTAV